MQVNRRLAGPANHHPSLLTAQLRHSQSDWAISRSFARTSVNDRCSRSGSAALEDPNLQLICAAHGAPLWEQAPQFHWDDTPGNRARVRVGPAGELVGLPQPLSVFVAGPHSWGRRPSVAAPVAEPRTLAPIHHRGLPKSAPADRRGVLFAPAGQSAPWHRARRGACVTVQFPILGCANRIPRGRMRFVSLVHQTGTRAGRPRGS